MNKKKLLIIISSIIAVITAIIIVLLIYNKKTITYKVSFETNGGSVVESEIVEKGKKVKKPVDPTKDGYMFVEWTYKGRTYDFSLEVTSNFTLTAKWVKLEEDKEPFIVKFETDGGTTISNQIIKKGNVVAKPIDPVKNGYTFEGWTLNGEVYDFKKIVEENIELKAKWEKVKKTNNNTTNYGSSSNSGTNTNKTTNNVSNSGTNNSTTTNNGSNSGTNNSTTTNNGSNSGTNNNKTTTPPTPTTTTTVKKYTVTFNSNGGTAVSSQTVTEGNKVFRPSNPTRDGYNFAGWLLNNSTYDFKSLVNGNITLVAKWNQKTYTVKATPVDQYSPDRILTVYEDGVQISVSAIKNNGVTLCSGSNMVVNMYEISNINSVTVVLTNGSSVTASVQ